MRRSVVVLLATYLFCRAALGAALNPLYNGPDESAHVEYVSALAQGERVSAASPEARQLPTYYALAAIPWRITAGQPEPTRVFVVRLVSALAGVATLTLIWRAARWIWPGHEAVAAIAASLTLAPGHVFVLASAGNDPLATALTTSSVAAALRLSVGAAARPRWWWALWLIASAAALLTKPTALPVIAASAGALIWKARTTLRARRSTRLALAAGLLVALGANAVLALQEPTSSGLASLARFWPLALVRAPIAYVARGGLAESFRTWWYGYDYLVRWPARLEIPLAASALVATGLALAGLVILWRRPAAPARPGLLAAPGVVWACAGAQVAFVLGRYGFGDVLKIEIGGAAQAKAFFPGLAPLTLLFAAGLVTASARLRLPAHGVARGLFGWLLALDAASLGITVWHHYRWWQVGG